MGNGTKELRKKLLTLRDITRIIPPMLKTKPVLDMPKKSASEDWSRHDVLYAVRRTGTTLQQLSLKLGYHRGTLGNALHTPAPKYERLIAEHLKRTVQDVWPTRYHPDGSPKSGRGERGLGRHKAKFNGSNRQCNVKLTEGQPA